MVEVSFKKYFIKDLKNLPKNIQEKIKKLVFEEIPNKNSLSEIPNVKKLKGADSYYRIRVGEYRIGFKYENGRIENKFIKNFHNCLLNYQFFNLSYIF